MIGGVDTPATRLTAADALLWDIEGDPCLRTTIVAVSLLDCSPDWNRFTRRISEVCDAIPRLRQRVVEAPLRLAPPHWQTVECVDLTYHLRRVQAPGRGDLRSVLDIAGPIAMGAFDKERPLWEFTLVEGLQGGRAALIQKFHHSLTDGVGAVQLAELLLDHSRAGRKRATRPSGAAGSSGAALPGSGPGSGPGSLLAPLLGSLFDPPRLFATTTKQLRSIGKLLAPVAKPLSPVMTERGLSRRLDTFDVSLHDVRAAAHAAGGTLNDAFLAGVAGGMQRYHDRHGAPVAGLRVTMPINLRKKGDPAGSNHFAPARFTLPISASDATGRMGEIGELARGWRREPALPLVDVIAAALTRLPRAATIAVFGGMLKAVDFVATNVPGLSHRSFLAGAEVVRQYAFAPPSGAALSIALLTHVDQCCVGINVDTDAVPDPEVMTACLREGFAEVVALGGAACMIA